MNAARSPNAAICRPLELKKIKDEASSALLEKQDQLETAIYAIHAAEVSGTAA